MNLSFTTTPKVIAAIFAALLAVLLFCAYKLNTSPSPSPSPSPSGIALTGFIFTCAALVVIACFTKIDVVLQVLRDELEPKTGTGSGSGSGSGSVNAIAPITPHPQRPPRYDIELALVHSLAPHLVNSSKAAELGAYIRAAADSILGAGKTCDRLEAAKSSLESSARRMAAAWDGVISSDVAGRHKCLSHGLAVCNCDQAFSISAQADQAAEVEIVAAGLTAPSVSAEQIQALMDKLIWVYDQPEGTTTTFAHAYLGRFYVATGYSGCVSPENFDAAKGIKYAREQAEGKVRDELWKLEGYKLHSAIAGQ